MSIEAMKQALEALEYPGPSWPESREKTAQALRQAIEQAEKQEPWKCACGANLYIDSSGRPASKAEKQEPVAYAVVGDGQWGEWLIGDQFETSKPPKHKYWENRGYELVPLYTPPAAQWVGLTDEERRACAQSPFVWENYLAIEAKLKEKNT